MATKTPTTPLQRMIAAHVAKNGKMAISTASGSPCTINTIRALRRAGYSVETVTKSLFLVYPERAA